MRVGSLCSGYGGLDLAVQTLWPCATPTWHSEVDPHASKVLAAHWPTTPNLGDLTTVDWGSVAPVDVLTAGYPCQPFSTAGRRKGEDDERHLWPGVLRAVRDLRPWLVLLENVAGHLSLGFGRVLGDLAEAGYVGSWTCLRASDVGACHRRERVFLAAHPADTIGGAAQLRRGPGPVARPAGDVEGERHQRQRGGDAAGCGDEDAANTEVAERRGTQQPHLAPACRPAAEPRERPCDLLDFGAFQPAVDRWAGIIGRPAPPGVVDGRLDARFVEWMMGLPEGWVTDLVPRRHALRILGNGVVPQQATAAYRSLLASLEVAL